MPIREACAAKMGQDNLGKRTTSDYEERVAIAQTICYAAILCVMNYMKIKVRRQLELEEWRGKGLHLGRNRVTIVASTKVSYQ